MKFKEHQIVSGVIGIILIISAVASKLF